MSRTELASCDTVVFDVDGTLVDSTYQHALAWYRAFLAVGVRLPLWRLHRHIGVGGDKFVAAVDSAEVEHAHGELLRSRHGVEFAALRAEVLPLAGAAQLLAAVHDRGLRVALATSGEPEETEHYLDLVGIRQVVDGWSSSADVDRSKPDPDVVAAAVERVGGTRGLVVGDSPWDCQAADRLQFPAVGLRCGGFATQELTDAGAARVYDGPGDLLADLSALLGDPQA